MAVEEVGKTVIYMGEEALRVYTNVRPVFGVRQDTPLHNAEDSSNAMKTFDVFLKEAAKQEKEKRLN